MKELRLSNGGKYTIWDIIGGYKIITNMLLLTGYCMDYSYQNSSSIGTGRFKIKPNLSL